MMHRKKTSALLTPVSAVSASLSTPSSAWVRDHYIDVSPRTIAREIRIVGCTVIEHEYGHLAGLGHSEDPAQRHLLADGLHRSAMPQAVPARERGRMVG